MLKIESDLKFLDFCFSDGSSEYLFFEFFIIKEARDLVTVDYRLSYWINCGCKR